MRFWMSIHHGDRSRQSGNSSLHTQFPLRKNAEPGPASSSISMPGIDNGDSSASCEIHEAMLDLPPSVALSGVQWRVTEWSGQPSRLLGDSSSAMLRSLKPSPLRPFADDRFDVKPTPNRKMNVRLYAYKGYSFSSTVSHCEDRRPLRGDFFGHDIVICDRGSHDSLLKQSIEE